MDNAAIARVLHEIADILEIQSENPFRIRSYRTAAETVANLGPSVAEMVHRGESLRSVPGIGEGIAAKLKELVEAGSMAYHQELLQVVPSSLLALLKIPGLGPKGVALVWKNLGVRSAADLEAVIADGRFRTLPGMKEKKEAKIKKGLEDMKAAPARLLLADAEPVVDALAGYLRQAGAQQIEAVGSFRRRRDTIGDLDIIVVGDGPALSEAFVSFSEVRDVLAHGEAKSAVVLRSGLQVDLRPFEPASLGAALQYFTGSKAHNVALRERAQKRGLKLNEYGVFRSDTGDKIAGASEQDVYGALGLPWIPPELREDRGEIAAAERGQLPSLITEADILGDLHCHTTESDGRDDLETMVEAARKRGLRYLAITEHSRAIPSPTRRTGMDESRCLEHRDRIRNHEQRAPGIALLAGIEVDILPDGRLDMADDVLAQLDLVVGSLHSRLDLDQNGMTRRVLRAFENPHLHVWGHPSARLLGRREAVPLDWEAIFAAAGQRGIALEINCQPDRRDLPDHLIRDARDRGVRFVISTDSHAAAQFANLHYGIATARRGWLTRGDVLNTLDVATFRERLRPRPA